MEVLRKIWAYMRFKRQDPEAPSSFNLKMMHGINKISILMFLAGVIYLIIRFSLR
ncbi:MAG: DUF6728 family protein [Bacteroidota bacterium]